MKRKIEFVMIQKKKKNTSNVQLINIRQLHIFSIKPKLDIQLFVDFCVFT